MAIAVLIRALADYAVDVPPTVELSQEYLDIALWQAARWGLSGRVLDPVAAELVPGETLVDTLLERARDYYPSAADREFAETGVRRIVERGTHAALLAAGGRYAELYTTQFADAE